MGELGWLGFVGLVGFSELGIAGLKVKVVYIQNRFQLSVDYHFSSVQFSSAPLDINKTKLLALLRLRFANN